MVFRRGGSAAFGSHPLYRAVIPPNGAPTFHARDSPATFHERRQTSLRVIAPRRASLIILLFRHPCLPPRRHPVSIIRAEGLTETSVQNGIFFLHIHGEIEFRRETRLVHRCWVSEPVVEVWHCRDSGGHLHLVLVVFLELPRGRRYLKNDFARVQFSKRTLFGRLEWPTPIVVNPSHRRSSYQQYDDTIRTSQARGHTVSEFLSRTRSGPARDYKGLAETRPPKLRRSVSQLLFKLQRYSPRGAVSRLAKHPAPAKYRQSAHYSKMRYFATGLWREILNSTGETSTENVHN